MCEPCWGTGWVGGALVGFRDRAGWAWGLGGAGGSGRCGWLADEQGTLATEGRGDGARARAQGELRVVDGVSAGLPQGRSSLGAVALPTAGTVTYPVRAQRCTVLNLLER